MDYPNIAFVEFETDQPGPPVSWFVDATPDQQAEMEQLLNEHLEKWQEPYVGPIKTISFYDFVTQFRESWIHEEDGEE